MDIKNEVKNSLGSVLDNELKEFGFIRRKGGLMYSRKLNDSKQEIHLNIEKSPIGFPDARVRISPSIRVKMPCITEFSLELAGDPYLLANAADLIIAQPIELLAPPDSRERWIVFRDAEASSLAVAIGEFIKTWAMPFFDECSTVLEFQKLYENSDTRIIKQQHWYVHVAASYLSLGEKQKAKDVLEKHLGAPGLKNKYANAFTKLA